MADSPMNMVWDALRRSIREGHRSHQDYRKVLFKPAAPGSRGDGPGVANRYNREAVGQSSRCRAKTETRICETVTRRAALPKFEGEPKPSRHQKGIERLRPEKSPGMPALQDRVSRAGRSCTSLRNIRFRGPRANEHSTQASQTSCEQVHRSRAALWHRLITVVMGLTFVVMLARIPIKSRGQRR